MPSKKYLRYLPPLLWMVFMFYLSSKTDLPSNQVYAVDFLTKKIAHVGEYFILTFLWANSLNRKTPDLAILYTLIYAFVDETHQLFVPYRTGNLRDVAIDFLGISVAAFIILKINTWKKYTYQAPAKTHKKLLKK